MTQVLEETTSLAEILTIQPGEVVIGKVLALDEQQVPWVDYLGNPAQQPQAAMTTLSLSQEHIGREVALLFAHGELAKPVIMGLIHPALTQPEPSTQALEARLDGQRVVLSARQEVVLQCGQASITLTRAGKIIIRGAYILSRASGLNRIKGAAVEVN